MMTVFYFQKYLESRIEFEYHNIIQYLYNFYPLLSLPESFDHKIPVNSWRFSRVAPLQKTVGRWSGNAGDLFPTPEVSHGFSMGRFGCVQVWGSFRFKLASSWNCGKESWEHARVSLKLPPVFSSMTDVAGPMEVGSCNAWKSRLMLFFPGKLSCF